jgi:hypothetical protein
LFSKKKIDQDISKKTEKISEVTIFKYQYFLNNKNRFLAVLKEEASDSLLPVYQVRRTPIVSEWLDLFFLHSLLCIQSLFLKF